MSAANIGLLVSDAWAKTLTETPWHADLNWFSPHVTYRERLDRTPRNCYGEAIPQRVILDNNLRRLAHRFNPARLPQ